MTVEEISEKVRSKGRVVRLTLDDIRELMGFPGWGEMMVDLEDHTDLFEVEFHIEGADEIYADPKKLPGTVSAKDITAFYVFR